MKGLSDGLLAVGLDSASSTRYLCGQDQSDLGREFMDDLGPWLPWISIAMSTLALLISWKGYRLSRSVQLSKRPYLESETLNNGDMLKLAGAEAAHWHIQSVRFLWPLRSQFMTWDAEYDDGGSILKSWDVLLGRKVEGRLPLIVSDTSRTSFALVTAVSKTRPRYTIRRLIKVRPKV